MRGRRQLPQSVVGVALPPPDWQRGVLLVGHTETYLVDNLRAPLLCF